MSQSLDEQARGTGTRFLVYPQNKRLKGFEHAEVVYINIPLGSIQAGPEDERMYVVDAKDKRHYQFEGEGPPYSGLRFPPVQPNREGHFDHIQPNTREFSSTVMYATVRRVLDIWEDYFEQPIQWFFHRRFNKLELIPLVEWDNAQSGYGFLEFGYGRNIDGSIDHSNPHCENFDVLAHETGHTIKNSIIGWPENQDTEEYHGHHEAFGDLVAIVSVLHFDSVINHVLYNTKGNLFSINELSRMGELSDSRQIRLAFNNMKMSDVKPVFDEILGKWVKKPHNLSQPFTGGAFDVLVEVFQQNLIERNLITPELGDQAYHALPNDVERIQAMFTRSYQGNEDQFKAALLDARDYFGRLMARAWIKTLPNDLHYWKVMNDMINADKELSNGKYETIIRSCFDWREIIANETDRPLLKTHIVDELAIPSVNNAQGVLTGHIQ
ncbi:hypothetical protein [Paenibacillus peoriae]|uniref:hypothetical protein n=1 Tax=Paenibacillus peoriae TaxID=59893 RepID=UPI00215A48D7|nr:hypothetical protein [Paenibacillus peoriae]